MNTYLSCSINCAVKINGNYKGQITNQPTLIPFEIGDLIEFVTIGKNCLPFCFIYDENILISPPEKIIVTDLDGGHLFHYDNFMIENQQFKVIKQQKFIDLVCTIFCDGNIKLSIETNNDFYAENIYFNVENADIDKLYINNKQFLIIVYSTCISKQVCIFTYENKIEKIFQKTINEIEFTTNLTTIEYLNDIAKHKITCEWTEQDGLIIEKNRKVTCSKDFCAHKLSPKILPYAFLEEYLCGGNCHNYLADNIKQNFDKLKGYFGDFIGIMPPPSFRDINEIGLIYKISQQKYKVEYFTFEIENNKITNLIKK